MVNPTAGHTSSPSVSTQQSQGTTAESAPLAAHKPTSRPPPPGFGQQQQGQWSRTTAKPGLFYRAGREFTDVLSRRWIGKAFYGVGALAFGFSAFHFGRYFLSKDYLHEVPGELLSIDEGSAGWLGVRYAYTFAHKQFVGTRLSLGSPLASEPVWGESGLVTALKELRTGSEPVTVHVDFRDPNVSALMSRPGWQAHLIVAAFGLLCIFNGRTVVGHAQRLAAMKRAQELTKSLRKGGSRLPPLAPEAPAGPAGLFGGVSGPTTPQGGGPSAAARKLKGPSAAPTF